MRSLSPKDALMNEMPLTEDTYNKNVLLYKAKLRHLDTSNQIEMLVSTGQDWKMWTERHQRERKENALIFSWLRENHEDSGLKNERWRSETET